MPVVEIHALPQEPPVDVSGVLGKVCLDLARALSVREKEVWATWSSLGAGAYAEGRDVARVQPRETHPPTVKILARETRPERIATMLEVVAGSVAEALGLEPGNVFVVYEILPAGQVFSGGGILGGRE